MNDETIKLLILGLFLIIATIVMHFSGGPTERKVQCRYDIQMKSHERNGVVSKKDYDNIIGGTEILYTTKKSKFGWEDDYYESRGRSFYHLVDIGDSISKAAGSLILEVHKPDTILYINLSIPCDEEKKEQ